MEAAAGSLRLSSGRDRRSLNSDGPCAPLAIRLLSGAAATAHEFEQALGVGGGQESLGCGSPRGCKESVMTD